MRTLTPLFLIALLMPVLQGCFPVVAGGVGAGVTMATDRRTSGIYIEDQTIELKSQSRVSDKLKDQVHLNVTSFTAFPALSGSS